MRNAHFAVATLALSLLAACGDDEPTPSADTSVADTSDASGDATSDTTDDTTETDTTDDTTETDTADDTNETDTADDTATDTATDATTDVATDATTDAATDAATDTAVDATDDTADVPDGPGCDPDATPFGGTAEILGDTFNLLCSPTHLDNIRTEPTGNFFQTDDITLTGVWTPIPEFQGQLIGTGAATIIGLTIESVAGTPNAAFISFLTNGATLQNLRFDDVSFTGYAGGPVASILQTEFFEDLGKPQGTDRVFVNDVHVRGDVVATDAAANGMFRVIRGGSFVQNVSFRGTITPAEGYTGGDANIAGICWRLLDATLQEVYVDAAITFPDHRYIGGAVAEASGEYTLSQAVVQGTVSGAGYVGGLAVSLSAGGFVEDSRVIALIEAPDTAGGIARGCAGTTTNSYTSIVTEDDTLPLAVDALCSFNNTESAHASGLVFNATTSQGGTKDTVSTALSDADMKRGASMAPWDTYDSALWVFDPGNLPVLAFEADLYAFP